MLNFMLRLFYTRGFSNFILNFSNRDKSAIFNFMDIHKVIQGFPWEELNLHNHNYCVKLDLPTISDLEFIKT
jgi:hypothetical protein